MRRKTLAIFAFSVFLIVPILALADAQGNDAGRVVQGAGTSILTGGTGGAAIYTGRH